MFWCLYWYIVKCFHHSPSICCCSVTQSCLILCYPMDCSTPGFPVLHYLLEFAQTHAHWVDDAIQLSQPLGLIHPLNPINIQLNILFFWWWEHLRSSLPANFKYIIQYCSLCSHCCALGPQHLLILYNWHFDPWPLTSIFPFLLPESLANHHSTLLLWVWLF